ncbi:hypothetical protein D9611_008472 [Ephemerocybe angulata]|uniref:F-box domain-containing protein n=1 Tax=Ephemerocybe angulata TaxID=980116 RepID=A0A8H5AYK2_9AGAR|nr:hypothetical protein D9611_008472 [Tulosesus angulatus]
MNRCLQAPEILQLICNQLPNDQKEDRQRLRALALSCRALLEPALDRLWYKVHSLAFFIPTLPASMWKVESVTPGSRPKYTLMGLNRAILTADLVRYLSYYAPRIQEIELGGLTSTFTVEAWQGLQAATSWKPGAMTPYVRTIRWDLSPRGDTSLSEKQLNRAFPYLSLFAGPTTKSLHLTFDSAVAIQMTSVQGAPNLCQALEEFSLTNLAGYWSTKAFIGDYLQSFSWQTLKVLKVTDVGHELYPSLSRLPNLTTLEISNIHGTTPHHYDSLGNPETDYISAIPHDAFPSLEVLKLKSQELYYLSNFLQQLPPNNRLHTLKFTLTFMYDEEHIDTLLEALKHHCNPETFRKLVLKESTHLEAEENEDLATYPRIDILSALQNLTALEVLSVSFATETVDLQPDDITNITKYWPNLVKLKIDVDYPSTRPPSINHDELLELIYGCPNLKKLGLRFDATQISEEEEVPECALYDTPAPIEKLWVCDSPIIRPSNWARFFEAHCPKLRKGATPLEVNGLPNYVPMVMYERRWNSVTDW